MAADIAHPHCGHGPKTQGPYLARRSRERAENIASDLLFATFSGYSTQCCTPSANRLPRTRR
ncbi:hypothetical protein MYCSP_16905 [Mycobacteroides saopaulense]|nr:hypothetical protein MYCSP_16905 [Mycobacteroides saopaulense]